MIEHNTTTSNLKKEMPVESQSSVSDILVVIVLASFLFEITV